MLTYSYAKKEEEIKGGAILLNDDQPLDLIPTHLKMIYDCITIGARTNYEHKTMFNNLNFS